jgi:hypothetical protein
VVGLASDLALCLHLRHALLNDMALGVLLRFQPVAIPKSRALQDAVLRLVIAVSSSAAIEFASFVRLVSSRRWGCDFL